MIFSVCLLVSVIRIKILNSVSRFLCLKASRNRSNRMGSQIFFKSGFSLTHSEEMSSIFSSILFERLPNLFSQDNESLIAAKRSLIIIKI